MIRKSIKQNKKAQVDFGPAVVIAVILTLILVAPIFIRIIGTVTGTFFTQMNESYSYAVEPASDAVDTVNNFFDYLIIIGIFVNVIVLFISAWFIDTNPAFIVLYIMFAFILFLFIPNLLDAVDRVWTQFDSIGSLDTWEDDDLNLTFTDFIRRNMMLFSLLIIFLTGILIYAKFKFTQGGF